ncbi:MAG: hypothetical protein ACK4UJ_10045 [Leptonema sp. (in: bacteria)]
MIANKFEYSYMDIQHKTKDFFSKKILASNFADYRFLKNSI